MPAQSNLTPREWASELYRMVQSPAWPLLHEWFKRVLVERAMLAPDPTAAGVEAAPQLRGVASFMLAIENEVTTKAGYVDGRSSRHNVGSAAGESGQGAAQGATGQRGAGRRAGRTTRAGGGSPAG